MKKTNKLNNQITINIDDATRDQLLKLCAAYNRKPAELVRLLLLPALVNEYALLMQQKHAQNREPWSRAAFNDGGR